LAEDAATSFSGGTFGQEREGKGRESAEGYLSIRPDLKEGSIVFKPHLDDGGSLSGFGK